MQPDGKASEFLRAFLDHRERLEFFIFRRVGCRATAADLMQELFLRLWGRPIERPEESAGYLFRSARNLVIDHQRSLRLRASHAASLLPEQQAAAPTSPEATVAARDELAGQQIRYGPDGAGAVTQADLDAAFAWQQGKARLLPRAHERGSGGASPPATVPSAASMARGGRCWVR